MLNTISLSVMVDVFRVAMGTQIDKSTCAHSNDKVISFSQIDNRLCGLDPSDNHWTYTHEEYNGLFNENNDKIAQLICAIEENLKHNSPSHKAKAKQNQSAHQASRTLTTADLNHMVRMDMVKDDEITTEEANLTEESNGPDVSEIKIKRAIIKSKHTMSKAIETPNEIFRYNEDAMISTGGLKVKVKVVNILI